MVQGSNVGAEESWTDESTDNTDTVGASTMSRRTKTSEGKSRVGADGIEINGRESAV